MSTDDRVVWTNGTYALHSFQYRGGLRSLVLIQSGSDEGKVYIEKFPDGQYYLNNDPQNSPVNILPKHIVAGPFPNEESAMAAARVLYT